MLPDEIQAIMRSTETEKLVEALRPLIQRVDDLEKRTRTLEASLRELDTVLSEAIRKHPELVNIPVEMNVSKDFDHITGKKPLIRPMSEEEIQRVKDHYNK